MNEVKRGPWAVGGGSLRPWVQQQRPLFLQVAPPREETAQSTRL